MKKETFVKYKGLPLVGNAVKVAYFSGLVKDIVKEQENKEPKKELADLTGNELESALKKEANDLFDEHITPEITAYQIPAPIVSKIKTKAINELSEVIKKKILGAAKNKIDKKPTE